MTKLTILNDIVSADLDQSLRIQRSWNIEIADLRGIYGKPILELSDEEARRAADAISSTDMSTYCLSFGLFYGDVEHGEKHFRNEYLAKVPRVIELARIFGPRVVRLLSAFSSKRTDFQHSVEYVRERHPWLFPVYREAVDQIVDAGFRPTMENEVRGNLLTNPEEIIDFFGELDCPGRLSFTYDVQNLWLMGTFPSVEVYRKLAHLTDYVHLKGGRTRTEGQGQTLYWQSSLEEASWPVADIMREVLQDGRCEAVCLNPSHGQTPEGYDASAVHASNVAFLRHRFPELL